MAALLITALIAPVAVLLGSVRPGRIVKEYAHGVLLRLNFTAGERDPGLRRIAAFLDQRSLVGPQRAWSGPACG